MKVFGFLTGRLFWKSLSALIATANLFTLVTMDLLALETDDVLVVRTTTPFLVVDSNNCAGGEGPNSAYFAVRITNDSGSDLNGVFVDLGDFDSAAGFDLAGSQPSNQFVGDLSAGEQRTIFWFIQYPCNEPLIDELTVTLGDANPGLDTVSLSVATESHISAAAGGQVTTTLLGPGAVVGQVIEYDVTYSFGNVQNEDIFNLQPVGNTDFNAGCLQLVGSEILASEVNAIPVGSVDRLFFQAGGNQGGTNHEVQARYRFLYRCDGVGTSAAPYAAQTSGSNNLKYTGNFDDQTLIEFPPASNAFSISKTAAPSVLPTGGTVTYTVTIENTSTFPAIFDTITDNLPSGVSYLGLDAASDVTAANSSSVPASGMTGLITWRSQPNDNYSVAANSSIQLVYTANVQNVEGAYTNSVQALSGQSSKGPVSTTVFVGDTADLSVTKIDLADPVSVGDSLTYQIDISNTGPDNATAVTLTDTLPTGVTFASSDPPAPTCSHAGGTVLCDLGTINSGTSTTVTITVMVDSPGTLTNQAAIESATLDPDEDNNLATEDTAVLAAPDLALTKTDSADPVLVGTNYVYELAVSNIGSAAATNVSLTDTLPVGVSFVSALSSQGTCTESSGTVSCSLLSISVGETVSVEIAVTALASGLVSNTASVTANEDESNVTNNNATETTNLVQPQLTASKTDSLFDDADGNGLASPGDTLLYQLTLQNSGNTAATGVVFSDIPGANLALVTGTVQTSSGTVVSGNGGGDTAVEVDIGTIAAAGSVTLSFQVTIDDPLPEGVDTVSNQGTVSSNELPVVPTDDPDQPGGEDPTTTVVTASPQLTASKTDSLFDDADGNGLASPGDTLLYQLTLQNSGNTAATGVVFSDIPGANLALVTGTVQTSSGTVVSGNGGGDTAVEVDIGTIAAAGSVTLSFQVTIDDPLPEGVDTVSNQGTVSSSELPVVPTDDPDQPGGEDPTTTVVTASPQLTASKTDSLFDDADGNGLASPGDTLLYQLTLQNSGNTAATGVVFSDIPGANTTLVAGTVQTSIGTVVSGNGGGDTAVEVDIGTIAAAGSVTLSFQVTIDDPLPEGVDTVSNQGTVSSNELPVVPTDDPDQPGGEDPTTTVVDASPQLTASKTDSLFDDADGNGQASPGDTLLYQLTLQNSGNTAATGVVFSDIPGANLALVTGTVQTSSGTVVSGNGGGDTAVEVDIGTIAAAGSVTLSFQVTIDDPLPGGIDTVSNQGTVSSNELPVVPTDDPDQPGGEDPTTTVVTATPLLSATKTDTLWVDADSNGVPSPGDTLLYQMVVANEGNQAVTTSFLNDTVDANTTLVVGSVQTSSGTVVSGNTAGDTAVEVDLGTIGGGGSITISFEVLIADPLPVGVTSVVNQGIVTTTELPPVFTDDPDQPGGEDPTTTVVDASPQLAASKTDSLFDDADGNGQASPGDTLLYQLTLQNSGNTAATGVVFSDIPGANLALVTGTVQTSSGTVVSGNGGGDTAVEVDIGTIAAAGSVTLSFQVTIDDPLPEGVDTVSNQGTVSSNELPVVPTDDPDQPGGEDPTTTVVTATPLLSATKTDTLWVDADSNGVPSPGDTLLYQMVVANEGNQAVTTSFLNDTVDANTTLVAGTVQTSSGTVVSGNTAGDTAVEVDLGTIGGGGSITISFEVLIADPLPVGVTSVVNQGIVTTTELPPVFTDDPDQPGGEDPTTTVVDASPQLAASKTDSLFDDADGNGLASPGDTLLYQLTLQNSGNTAATGVVFSDIPGANLTLVAGTVQTSAGTVVSGNSGGDTAVEVDIGTIAAAGSVTLSFQVTIDDPLPEGVDTVSNQGTVSSNELPVVPTDDPDQPGGEDPTTTVVTATPLLSATKTDTLWVDADSNGVPSPGDTLLYQMVVANEGNQAVTTSFLNDTVDANTTLVVGTVQTSSGTVVSGNTAGDTAVEVDLGTIGGGGSITISFEVLIADPLPVGVTSVVNQGIVTTTELPPVFTDDPDQPGGEDPTTTVVDASPQLAASKTDSLFDDADGNGQASPGDTLLYQLTLQNSGNTAATGVVFSDIPGANLTLVAGTVQTSSGTVVSGNGGGDTAVEVDIGTIAAAGSVTLSFQVTIDDPLPEGVDTVSNQGTVSSNELPVVPTDDPDQPGGEDPTTTVVTATPLLSATKTDTLWVDADSNGVPSPGDTLLYQMVVANEGNQAVTTSFLNDTVDANTTLVAGTVQTSSGTVVSGNTAGDTAVEVDLGTIGGGGSITISFEVLIADPLPVGVTSVVNQGIVTTTELPPVFTDDPDQPGGEDPTTTVVDASPQPSSSDLQLTKTASVDSVNINSEFSFTITVQNIGPANATGVSLVDELPSGLSVSDIVASQGTCVLDGLSINCSLGEMEPEAIVTVTIMVQAEAPGILVNTATVSALEADPTPEDNNDTAQTIARSADAIPTFTEWGLILLTGLLLLFGVRRLRNGQSQLAG